MESLLCHQTCRNRGQQKSLWLTTLDLPGGGQDLTNTTVKSLGSRGPHIHSGEGVCAQLGVVSYVRDLPKRNIWQTPPWRWSPPLSSISSCCPHVCPPWALLVSSLLRSSQHCIVIPGVCVPFSLELDHLPGTNVCPVSLFLFSAEHSSRMWQALRMLLKGTPFDGTKEDVVKPMHWSSFPTPAFTVSLGHLNWQHCFSKTKLSLKHPPPSPGRQTWCLRPARLLHRRPHSSPPRPQPLPIIHCPPIFTGLPWWLRRSRHNQELLTGRSQSHPVSFLYLHELPPTLSPTLTWIPSPLILRQPPQSGFSPSFGWMSTSPMSSSFPNGPPVPRVLLRKQIWSYYLRTSKTSKRSFPGGSGVKNPPVDAGDMASIPDSGRSHMPRSN